MDNLWRQVFPPRVRGPARFCFGLLIAAGVLFTQVPHQKAGLEVYFFDVGQGDGSLIKFGDYEALIDGGPSAKIVQKLGEVMPFYDRDLELMILTHPHADHITGQIEVLRRYNVKKVIYTGVAHTTDEYLSWLQEIKKQNIPMEIAKVGAQYVIASEGQRSEAIPSDKEGDRHALPSQSGGLAMTPSPVLDILWPKDELSSQRVAGQAQDGGGLNDTSIVARLVYGQTGFLFMGDASSDVENKLMASDQVKLQSDVLKVGHHGSRFSTSKEFVEAVQPKYAVIQVGKNDYGHPAFKTIWYLEQAGIKVLRNDQDGDIAFTSDGKQIKVANNK